MVLARFLRKNAPRKGGRVVFGCLVDTSGHFADQAARLLLSLRWFGGAQADAHFLLAVVGSLSKAEQSFFIRHCAEIVVVSQLDERHGPSNKLRFFELPQLNQFDHIVLLDCDTIVVQDPSDWIYTNDFSAKPADQPTVDVDALGKYLSHYDIPVPCRAYHHDVADVPGLPYFNSGVIVLGRKWRRKFLLAWKKYTLDLIGSSNLFGINEYHVDQAGLTAAVLAENIPIDPLPTAMNFPAHFPEHRYPQTIWNIDPIIIHYHHLGDCSGYIKPLPCPRVRLRANMFNSRLRAEFGGYSIMKPASGAGIQKIIVGTGWWSSEEKGQWSIGSDVARSAAFFTTWYNQVTKCISPTKIIVTDSNSPNKPDFAACHNVEWISLDQNYGHPNDLRIGKIQAKFSGYTRSVVNAAMYAYCCDADIFVYVEQDCLIRGDDFLSHAIGDSKDDILLGAKTHGGQGIEGQQAAAMHQNSLIIVHRRGLERFIVGILNSPHGDGEQSIEIIMQRQFAPFGVIAVPYGRSRPIDFKLTHFYAQHMTDDELGRFMDVENLKRDLSLPTIYSA